MIKKFTPTPHDAVFRQFLSEKETAKGFFEIWLPDEIKALRDLDSLKVESGSFVDSEMKNYQSYILYSVNTQQGQGYIYLLIEHQSTPDKLMAWRLMLYSMADMVVSYIDGLIDLVEVAGAGSLNTEEENKQFQNSLKTVREKMAQRLTKMRINQSHLLELERNLHYLRQQLSSGLSDRLMSNYQFGG